MSKRFFVVALLAIAAMMPFGVAKALNPPSGFTADKSIIFTTSCKVAGYRSDDPIVYPNQPGASHQHVFFGSKVMSATTTRAQALAGGTTCGISGDTAGYWVPSLKVGGVVSPNRTSTFYYWAQGDRSKVRAFPANLKMISGNPDATSPQSRSVFEYNCRVRGSEGTVHKTLVANEPICASSDRLSAWMRFPDCWDGVHLDSADHRSHMAWSDGSYQCPASHPVKVPRIRITLMWETSGGTNVTLSSGSRYGMHGDFWNTWNQSALVSKIGR
jgi:hypothetical protein